MSKTITMREKIQNNKEYREYLEGVLRKVQEFLMVCPVYYEEGFELCIFCNRVYEHDPSCKYNTIKQLVDETLR